MTRKLLDDCFLHDKDRLRHDDAVALIRERLQRDEAEPDGSLREARPEERFSVKTELIVLRDSSTRVLVLGAVSEITKSHSFEGHPGAQRG